jgi:hypothetical protein
MRQDQLRHEGLEAKAIALDLHPSRPVLDETRDLRKVRFVRLLTRPDEVEVARDAGLEKRSVILTDEVAVPIGIAVIQNRDDIHIKVNWDSFDTVGADFEGLLLKGLNARDREASTLL